MLQEDDLEHVVRLYTNVDVRRFLGGTVEEESVRVLVAKLVQSKPPARYWTVYAQDGSEFIGLVSLDVHHNGMDVEVSYQFLPKWWGQGYAYEVVQAVVNYGLHDLGLQRVIAETQTANVASCKLLAHLGMRLEETLERFGVEQAIYVTGIRE